MKLTTAQIGCLRAATTGPLRRSRSGFTSKEGTWYSHQTVGSLLRHGLLAHVGVRAVGSVAATGKGYELLRDRQAVSS